MRKAIKRNVRVRLLTCKLVLTIVLKQIGFSYQNRSILYASYKLP